MATTTYKKLQEYNIVIRMTAGSKIIHLKDKTAISAKTRAWRKFRREFKRHDFSVLTETQDERKQYPLLEAISMRYDGEDILKADGLDRAIIGIEEHSMRLIYSETKVIGILMEQGMTWEEAWEYYGFNIKDAYVGENTPIWCEDDL